MTPKQKAKFEEFKEWLLVWKDEYRKEYKDFARKMNSDDPMAFLGMAQLLITVCPELIATVVDCWDDDTLSADDWVDKANGIIMNYKDSNVTYGNYGYPLLQLANGYDEDETPVELSTEEQMERAKAFIEENGSIAEFAQGIMRQILGDTEVPSCSRCLMRRSENCKERSTLLCKAMKQMKARRPMRLWKGSERVPHAWCFQRQRLSCWLLSCS